MIDFDNKEDVESFIQELNNIFTSKGIQNVLIERKEKISTIINSQILSYEVHFQIIFPITSQENMQIIEDELKELFKKQQLINEVEIIKSESANQSNDWKIVARLRKSR